MTYRHLLLLLVCLLPLQTVLAHESESLSEHQQLADPPSTWLDERLGDYIPLDARFTDASGRKLQLAELIDRPTLMVPVYYSCRNVCNFLLGGLVEALPDIKLEPGVDYRVVTFSIDAEENTAIAARSKKTFMTALSNNFPADAWTFLTGDSNNIHLVTDAAGYRFQKKGDDFLHPVAAFVVSDKGKIVRYLNGYRFAPFELTLALIEASEGRVGTPIRKALQFCFSYDPQGRTYVFNLLRVSGTVILLTLGSFLTYLILSGRKK